MNNEKSLTKILTNTDVNLSDTERLDDVLSDGRVLKLCHIKSGGFSIGEERMHHGKKDLQPWQRGERC